MTISITQLRTLWPTKMMCLQGIPVQWWHTYRVKKKPTF